MARSAGGVYLISYNKKGDPKSRLFAVTIPAESDRSFYKSSVSFTTAPISKCLNPHRVRQVLLQNFHYTQGFLLRIGLNPRRVRQVLLQRTFRGEEVDTFMS